MALVLELLLLVRVLLVLLPSLAEVPAQGLQGVVSPVIPPAELLALLGRMLLLVVWLKCLGLPGHCQCVLWACHGSVCCLPSGGSSVPAIFMGEGTLAVFWCTPSGWHGLRAMLLGLDRCGSRCSCMTWPDARIPLTMAMVRKL